MKDHYVCVASTYQRGMMHPDGCGPDTDCEYNKVVLDGQTFEGMRPGYYRLVGYDPDSYHPFIAWERK